MEQRKIGGDCQKWVAKLMAFDFEISYKPGANNRVADDLSRLPVNKVECSTLVAASYINWDQIHKENERDPFIT